MSPAIQLEVCVESVESARAAEQGGAARVEVCSALEVGGLTPSAGLIAMVRRNIAIPVHVLIRPRAGDFVYSADELDVMRRDILLARQLGAHGIAIGVLDSQGRIDVENTRALVELAAPMQVTFHRAFDFAGTLAEALQSVIATGATRVLTSGGAPTAEAGSVALNDLVVQAKSRIVIMAAGKIRANNVARLVQATGVSEIHANLASPIPSPAPTPSQIALGTKPESNQARTQVLSATVAALLEAASGVV
jgi:copper homeostasis protein